jgi:hypothetical protein
MPSTSYDHEIQAGTTVTKLKLLKDSNGQPMYNVAEIVPDHQQLLEVGQKDWTGGHGQYEYENPTMYFDGQSIDTTQENRVLLGPQINVESTGSVQKQNYTAGYDSTASVYGVNWGAQTFTPADNHTVGYLKLYLKCRSGCGYVTVSIRNTVVGPSGPDLLTITFNGEDYSPLSAAMSWITIPLGNGLSLTSGVIYGIVLRAPTASVAMPYCGVLMLQLPHTRVVMLGPVEIVVVLGDWQGRKTISYLRNGQQQRLHQVVFLYVSSGPVP